MKKTFDDIPGVEWVEGAGEFIQINSERCTGCANCVRVCLAGCYAVEQKKAKITGLERCMECGACWYACLDGAIEFAWPPGGTGFRTDWG